MHPVSGKFVLRLAPELHTLLHEFANRRNLSLNQFCVERLLGNIGHSPQFQKVVLGALYQALKIHGQELLGTILFGSWARNEQGEGSDIDLLIVLKEGSPIKRELYRPWEDREESIGFAIQPSIVALPHAQQPISGLWAEISIDGIILFETKSEIRQYLLRVRQAIADGSLRRERAHGQNYWIHESQVA